MKVRVDGDRCQGHTLCAVVAPSIFHLREEDGQAWVDAEVVRNEDEERVRLAAAGCPEGAIVVDE